LGRRSSPRIIPPISGCNCSACQANRIRIKAQQQALSAKKIARVELAKKLNTTADAMARFGIFLTKANHEAPYPCPFCGENLEKVKELNKEGVTYWRHLAPGNKCLMFGKTVLQIVDDSSFLNAMMNCNINGDYTFASFWNRRIREKKFMHIIRKLVSQLGKFKSIEEVKKEIQKEINVVQETKDSSLD